GHEWSGVVEEVGEAVRGIAPGDKVVCEGFCYCGVCLRCRSGDTHLCATYDQLGFTRGGGDRELVLAPPRVVPRLPDGVELDAAVLVEPASVVLQGLQRARVQPGETIGVIGVGTLGALTLVLARLFSPGAVVAYGVREAELELARRLGADETVDLSAGPATHDGELDLVVETAGAVAAIELATRLPRMGGRVVALGIAGAGRELTLPADRFVLRDLSLIGSVGYTTAIWSQVVDLLGAGLVDFAPVVARRVPADRFEEAFGLMADPDGVVGRILLPHGTGAAAACPAGGSSSAAPVPGRRDSRSPSCSAPRQRSRATAAGTIRHIRVGGSSSSATTPSIRCSSRPSSA